MTFLDITVIKLYFQENTLNFYANTFPLESLVSNAVFVQRLISTNVFLCQLKFFYVVNGTVETGLITRVKLRGFQWTLLCALFRELL